MLMTKAFREKYIPSTLLSDRGLLETDADGREQSRAAGEQNTKNTPPSGLPGGGVFAFNINE